MSVYDEEPREDQDWEDQCMNELIDEIQNLASKDPNERLSLLAKEFRRTASEAHPELTDWTLWEGKSTYGNQTVFFTLSGTLPS